MLRKALKALGWSAAGLIGLCVVLYGVALALNWRDREPNAAAIRLTGMYRDRPAVADQDNAFLYLRRWQVGDRRDKLPGGALQLQEACRTSHAACTVAFDSADGLLDEWQVTEGDLADRYSAFIAHADWREPDSFDPELTSIPNYSAAMDGQRLQLLRARELAKQGQATAVRGVLERDLQFWRTVLQSSDTLISKMIATAALHRHFEWGYRVLLLLPAQSQPAALPDGWRNAISDAERSMTRCVVGEWMFLSQMLRTMDTSNLDTDEDGSAGERMLAWLEQPMFEVQDTTNRFADHYWQVAQMLDAPLERYEETLRRVDHWTEQTAKNASAARALYNRRGIRVLSDVGSLSGYAARVGDIEGVRRSALLAATLRAAGIEAKDMPVTVANAELRDPYTDRPFGWDATDRALVFRGLEPHERGEHRIYY